MTEIPPSEERKIIGNEIQIKWTKFSDRHRFALRDKDHLVAQVQSMYKLDKAEALKEVEALLDGRDF